MYYSLSTSISWLKELGICAEGLWIRVYEFKVFRVIRVIRVKDICRWRFMNSLWISGKKFQMWKRNLQILNKMLKPNNETSLKCKYQPWFVRGFQPPF